MTKAELLQALEPFSDDIELIIDNRGEGFTISRSRYLNLGGDGYLVVSVGALAFLQLPRASADNSTAPHG